MRKKKFSSSMEDYLEAIYWQIEEKGEARMSEISSFLGHKPPSVTEMLEKLSERGLIKHKKYGVILLTPRGRKIAKEVSSRHKILTSFLELLGINKKIAEVDACKIEHVVDPKTIDRLRKFVEFMGEAPISSRWLTHYNHFVKTGKHPRHQGKFS
jgi:Mn-dependent DtxR family transcriptional regulator